MPIRTVAPTTFVEFEALPEIKGKRELIDGELIEGPPPENVQVSPGESLSCSSIVWARVACGRTLPATVSAKATKRRAITIYSRLHDKVIRHAVGREFGSEAAGAVFSLAFAFTIFVGS